MVRLISYPIACQKISNDYLDASEADRRSCSTVISGPKESFDGGSTHKRHRDLFENLCDVVDVLNVECGPPAVSRMGKPDPSRPRLVKVVLRPVRTGIELLPMPAFFGRTSGLEDVFVRRSTNPEERKRDFELTIGKLAKERNVSKARREWVASDN